MIRINLLPHKRETRRDFGQGWLLIVSIALLANVLVLFFIHQYKERELGKQREINRELSSQISQSESTVKNHADLKTKLEEFRAREEAIAQLQSARTGPTAILLELSRILTKDRGPTISSEELMQKRKDSPQDVYRESWDPKRLWLLSLKEHQRTVKLEGLAHDGEDVSELARRLSLSKYFEEVTLLPAKQQNDSETKLNLVKFQVQAKARY